MGPKIVLSVAFSLAMSTQAALAASGSAQGHLMPQSASACEEAHLASWFDAQRQLTDGNVDPRQAAVALAGCEKRAFSAAEPTQAQAPQPRVRVNGASRNAHG